MSKCLHCNAQLRGAQVQSRWCYYCKKPWKQKPPLPATPATIDKVVDQIHKDASERPPPAGSKPEKKKVSLERLLRNRGVPSGPDSYPLKKVLVELAEEFEVELPPKATKVEIWQLLDDFTYEE